MNPGYGRRDFMCLLLERKFKYMLPGAGSTAKENGPGRFFLIALVH
jgi:hypothetical protein